MKKNIILCFPESCIFVGCIVSELDKQHKCLAYFHAEGEFEFQITLLFIRSIFVLVRSKYMSFIIHVLCTNQKRSTFIYY